ncbi:MAG: MFS transporter [Candidatus Hodarchaeota archaeon]
MERSTISLKPLIFDLYLRPSLLLIGLYQIILTAVFTAQQLLLAAYLDELGFILISGIILAVYFLFWIILAPIFGALSDLHGRKFLMIAGNFVSSIGFFGFVLAPEPLLLFFLNALLGVGTSLRVGSGIALWVQHSPENRVGESLAYHNILIAAGGIGGGLIGFFMWTAIKEVSFIIFGILLLVVAIPVIFLSDSGDYIPFSLESLINILREKSHQNFFVSRPILQVCIHWIAFSTIISFSTFIIPIIERVIEELPTGSELFLPLPLLFVISLSLVASCLGGLLVWGRVSDSWARRPVLFIGYAGTVLLLLLALILIQFNLLPILIDGLIGNEPLSIAIIGLFFLSVFTVVSLIPTPMAWITDKVGEGDLAKAMSLRQVSIGVGTIIGALVGGFIIGGFGIGGLLLIIIFFLVISAVILL